MHINLRFHQIYFQVVLSQVILGVASYQLTNLAFITTPAHYPYVTTNHADRTVDSPVTI